MQKSALLAAIQQEIQRHDFSHFVRESAVDCQWWHRCSCARLSGVQEANQFDESVSRSSGKRCDARAAGPAVKSTGMTRALVTRRPQVPSAPPPVAGMGPLFRA